VVTGAYRDLFAATAGAAAALTGLLFVAMSVASQRALVRGPLVIRQIRASAALLAFSSTLAIALFGLVPGTNIGYPAVVVATIGIMFIAAAVRSIVTSRSAPSLVRSQIGLILILLLICFTELIAGIVVLANAASTTSVQVIGYAVVTSVLVGIGRAWEFIGERDTGILASLGILTGHTARPRAADPDGDEGTGPGGADTPPADGPGHSAEHEDGSG
jgi:modulator of FtsH protease